jgi:hypothetical protein
LLASQFTAPVFFVSFEKPRPSSLTELADKK